jgi:hypothetical protein
MNIKNTLRRHKRRIIKRFRKEIGRKQFNILLDTQLVWILKGWARRLECPVYIISEHAIQIGLAEIAVALEDDALREQLCRHLVEEHLLVPVTQPLAEPISRRLLQLKNAMNFMKILDYACSREQQQQVILKLLEDCRRQRG